VVVGVGVGVKSLRLRSLRAMAVVRTVA